MLRLFSEQRLSFAMLTRPGPVAFAIAALFSLRVLNCLPFSGATRIFNYETVSTLTSFLIFAAEPFSFPLGVIHGLTFPFTDANVGNVGALPLFAIAFKALGKIIPYFQTFDYFVLVEIISCFLTALFVQKILIRLDVRWIGFRLLGALLIGVSFLILTRSAWHQSFCVVSFPIFTAWIYAMLLTLQRGQWRVGQDIAILSLFPIVTLLDNYSLVGILLGTGLLLLREFFEAIFGGLATSWNRFHRLLFFCAGGVTLSVLALYVIGMFPLPSFPNTFSSYDFGMGGRYHVADLFGPWIPVGKGGAFVEPSLLGRLGFPVNTDQLGAGQYEGVAYIGTSAFLMWVSLAAWWFFSFFTRSQKACSYKGLHQNKLVLYSPWKKVMVAVVFVFIFSLGYELHILGHAFPDFSGMLAAWIADRAPSLYNIRAPGRLAPLLSIFLVLEVVRRFHLRHEEISSRLVNRSARFPYFSFCVVSVFMVIHLVEIAPFLRPVPVQPLQPVGGIYSVEEIREIRNIAAHYDVLLASPSVRAANVTWTTEAYSLAYFSGLQSNLYYIARTDPNHDIRIRGDLNRVINGDWDVLIQQYGKVLFAIPAERAESLRVKMRGRYQETRIGNVSLWGLREKENQAEKVHQGRKQL